MQGVQVRPRSTFVTQFWVCLGAFGKFSFAQTPTTQSPWFVDCCFVCVCNKVALPHVDRSLLIRLYHMHARSRR